MNVLFTALITLITAIISLLAIDRGSLWCSEAGSGK